MAGCIFSSGEDSFATKNTLASSLVHFVDFMQSHHAANEIDKKGLLINCDFEAYDLKRD